MAVPSSILNEYTLLYTISAIALLFLFPSLYIIFADERKFRKLPLIGKEKYEITNTNAKQRFLTGAKDLIQHGLANVSSILSSIFTAIPNFEILIDSVTALSG
jgi:hypothetical protein